MFSTIGIFTANILLLKKIARVARLRARCIYAAGAKRKQLAVPIGESLSKQMVEKIETEAGTPNLPATPGHSRARVCQYSE